jgi:uncharacterized OB-fold protein
MTLHCRKCKECGALDIRTRYRCRSCGGAELADGAVTGLGVVIASADTDDSRFVAVRLDEGFLLLASAPIEAGVQSGARIKLTARADGTLLCAGA